jgi:hypothetical protein
MRRIVTGTAGRKALTGAYRGIAGPEAPEAQWHHAQGAIPYWEYERAEQVATPQSITTTV